MSDIDPEMPLYLKRPNGNIYDLPDYYEIVARVENKGFTSAGTTKKRNVKYAVRPLTEREQELLKERERMEFM